jgi:two-component system, cell cycle sensor histidine kinase and response regulator CckA
MTSPPLPGPNAPVEGVGQRSVALFENAPVGLWEADATGIIVAINQTLLGWLASTRFEIVDRQKVEALVSPESIAIVQVIAERCRADGQATGVMLTWRGDDERPYWLGEVTATAVYDAQGQWRGWRGSVRAVPKATGEMDRLLQERTLEAIERLAGGVAHKFNNLLQVIQGYAELGLITLESSHPVHGNLARIKEAAQRAAGLVQGLVAFGRRQTVRRRPLELGAFMAQLEGRLRRVVPASVELHVRPATQRIRVLADASSLEQVVIQLVMNACEAMPHGGIVALETRLVRDPTDGRPAGLPTGTYVCISVSDTGVGIDPGLVGQIFEPFFTTKDTASGLGLAVVWGVVKQHEGRVEMTNQPGRGATFRVFLPAEDLTTSESAAAALS